MGKMKEYMQEQADQMDMTVEEYLNFLNTPKEPEDYEPDYSYPSMEEVKEQLNNWRSLK